MSGFLLLLLLLRLDFRWVVLLLMGLLMERLIMVEKRKSEDERSPIVARVGN